MTYGSITLEKRIKDNITNYQLNDLYHMEQLKRFLEATADIMHIGFVLTLRHGEPLLNVNISENFIYHANNPGRRIRIAERTVGYLAVDEKDKELSQAENKMLDCIAEQITALGSETYYHKELAAYADETRQQCERETLEVLHGDKVDVLTKTLNRTYFEKRLAVVDRSEIVPIGVVCGNINDWKYVNDNYGNDESDRLIKVIADIMKKKAQDSYIIGRCDGDVFHVVIPFAQEGEAEDYCKSVQEACTAFEDAILAPSIAFGIVIKTNVEQKLSHLFSDAEYEMFNDKFALKNAAGYRKRLEKGKC